MTKTENPVQLVSFEVLLHSLSKHGTHTTLNQTPFGGTKELPANEAKLSLSVFSFHIQNPKTVSLVQDLVKEGAVEALKKCFSSRMEFGTAGLRAAMGAGISRMNDLTIIQTTQVAKYVICEVSSHM